MRPLRAEVCSHQAGLEWQGERNAGIIERVHIDIAGHTRAGCVVECGECGIFAVLLRPRGCPVNVFLDLKGGCRLGRSRGDGWLRECGGYSRGDIMSRNSGSL